MKWQEKKTDIRISEYISQKLGISPFLAQILNSRGIDTPEKAFYFLYGNFHNTPSPFIFSQMEKTVEYLRALIQEKRNIYIMGDKDVDGITGTAILYSFFKKMGLPSVWYNLPTDKESYGFSERIFKHILNQKNLDTVITVDCGIKENDFIYRLQNHSIATIVTDHHTPSETLPDAFSIINPYLESDYDIHYLSGAAVAFKVIQGLYFSYHSLYGKKIIFLYWNGVFRGISAVNFVPDKEELTFSSLGELKDWIKEQPELILVAEGEALKMLKGTVAEKDGRTLLDVLYLVSHNMKQPYQLLNLEKASRIMTVYYDSLKPHRTVFSLFKKIFFKFYLKIEEKLESFLKYATLGTVCDYMPINNVENHILIRSGLDLLNKNTPYFIRLITEDKKTLNMQDISFFISPFLNSGGRLGESQLSFQFIIEEEEEKVEHIYLRLKKLNQQRKKIGDDAYQEAVNQIELYQKEEEVLFYSSPNIIQGVTGILATKISRFFRKPSFAFYIDQEKNEIVGSGRTFQSLNILTILEDCTGIFSRFGGHPRACGMTFPMDYLDEVIERIRENTKKKMEEKTEDETLFFDLEIDPQHLGFGFLQEMKKLSPFGPENEKPVLFSRNLTPLSYKRIGKNFNHIKFKIRENPSIDFIGWNMADNEDLLKNSRINLVYQLQENFYNNHLYLQGCILDMWETLY